MFLKSIDLVYANMNRQNKENSILFKYLTANKIFKFKIW